jgi:hypothetical protein
MAITEVFMAISPLVHDKLANAGLSSLPHDCPHEGCAGRFERQALDELIAAARYAANTGKLPPEAETMLRAPLHKIGVLKSSSV